MPNYDIMVQSWKKEPVTQRYDILLFDQFSNHCLANTVEPMRAANAIARAPLYAWRFMSLDGAEVISSSGLLIRPEIALAQGQGDAAFVMPSYGFRTLANSKTAHGLLQASKRYAVLAGLDTGSWLLAHAGLLDGRRGTIHWDELAGFAEAFPQVDVVRERFVLDGNRITCSGAMAAFDLVMQMIVQAHGPRLGLEVAQMFMAQSGADPMAPFTRSGKRSVDRAIAAMHENIEHPLGIGALARVAGVSQKTLVSRMVGEFGATPQAIYKTIRLTHARKLVTETEQSILEIANRCGYDDASAMTRAFRAEFAETPRDLRR